MWINPPLKTAGQLIVLADNSLTYPDIYRDIFKMECFEWSVGTEKNSMLVVPSVHMSSVKKLFCFGGVFKNPVTV